MIKVGRLRLGGRHRRAAAFYGHRRVTQAMLRELAAGQVTAALQESIPWAKAPPEFWALAGMLSGGVLAVAVLVGMLLTGGLG